jgi:hypothetical protein
VRAHQPPRRLHSDGEAQALFRREETVRLRPSVYQRFQ